MSERGKRIIADGCLSVFRFHPNPEFAVHYVSASKHEVATIADELPFCTTLCFEALTNYLLSFIFFIKIIPDNVIIQYMIPPIHTSTTSLTNKLLIDILTFTISSIKSMTIPPTRNITPGNITFFKTIIFLEK